MDNRDYIEQNLPYMAFLDKVVEFVKDKLTPTCVVEKYYFGKEEFPTAIRITVGGFKFHQDIIKLQTLSLYEHKEFPRYSLHDAEIMGTYIISNFREQWNKIILKN